MKTSIRTVCLFLLVLLLVGAVTASGAGTQQPQQEVLYCGNSVITIDCNTQVWPDYPCTCYGTAGRDVIGDTAGNDIICAGGGNDLICAGIGQDVVHAEGGSDVVYLGGDGYRDVAWGGDEPDFLGFIGTGPKTLHGEDGNDTLAGGFGADILWGDAGDDTLTGYLSGDTLLGGTGRDYLDGGPGSDFCYGGTDTDPDSAVRCEQYVNIP